MSIAEGVAARVSYKAYTSGEMVSNQLPDIATSPGASGGQQLRNTTCSLKLGKDVYRPNERSSTRQTRSVRHGTQRVSGGVSGDYSPGTYFDFFEAAFRGNRVASKSVTETQVTSLAADGSAGTLTLGAGNWSDHFEAGDTVRITNHAEAGLNNINFVLLGFTGAVADVYPKPVTAAADTTVTITRPGAKVSVPLSGHVSRKFAVEVHQQDLDLCRLFTEIRIGGVQLRSPATGNATVDFSMMGRDMKLLTGAQAPYFTSPAAETDTDILAAVGGLLIVGGTRVGVVTGLDMNLNLNPASDAVWGQNFVPEVHLGKAAVTGTITALLEDGYFLNQFINEEEIGVLAHMKADSSANGAFNTIQLQRIKFTDADAPSQGEGSQTITMPFEAMLPDAATGYDRSTIVLHDSEAV